MRKNISLFFLILQILPLAAQESGEESTRGIQLRGFAFSLFDGVDKLQLRNENRNLCELELPTGQLINRVSVSSRNFSFGVTAGDVFTPLGKVVLPRTGKDFILVFAPTKDGYRAFPIRTDDPEFRGDDKHVFNFTTHRLGILLGTAKQAVDSFQNARLRPGFPPDSTFYQAMFTYEKKGRYIPFNNTRWPVNSNTKALIFVFEDPTSGRLAYRSVTELAK